MEVITRGKEGGKNSGKKKVGADFCGERREEGIREICKEEEGNTERNNFKKRERPKQRALLGGLQAPPRPRKKEATSEHV